MLQSELTNEKLEASNTNNVGKCLFMSPLTNDELAASEDNKGTQFHKRTVRERERENCWAINRPEVDLGSYRPVCAGWLGLRLLSGNYYWSRPHHYSPHQHFQFPKIPFPALCISTALVRVKKN